MTFRSLILGAVLLSVAAPAAFAASSDDSFQYRDKPNNGGAAVSTMATGSTSGADIAAFEAVDGTVKAVSGVAGDYWLGKSDNGYNK